MSTEQLATVDLDGPIATVRMADRQGDNHIRPALERAVLEAFDAVVADPDIRVVILAGLPKVFCAGAPAEDLAEASGQRTMDKLPFVRVALDCPLPVIAAVEGHAVGGGLLLAAYADVAILSAEAHYAANFVSLGFTPCLGATYVLPAKFGSVLSRDMLLSGRALTGRELAARGCPFPAVSRTDVLPQAQTLAYRMAQAPRRSLELLKKQLAEADRQLADSALRRELPDHLTTFEKGR